VRCVNFEWLAFDYLSIRGFTGYAEARKRLGSTHSGGIPRSIGPWSDVKRTPGSDESGGGGNETMTTELKAWVFLIASFVLLVCICGLAMLGLLTRPMRWSERA
jgi:hypothetical protein